jgi:hypothetical protein
MATANAGGRHQAGAVPRHRVDAQDACADCGHHVARHEDGGGAPGPCSACGCPRVNPGWPSALPWVLCAIGFLVVVVVAVGPWAGWMP